MKMHVPVIRDMQSRLRDIASNAQVKRFVSNLGTVFLFRFAAAVLNAVGLVAAARYFGVVAVGDINIIQNAGFFLIIPMLIGVNVAIVKYLPAGNAEEQGRLIGSVFVWNAALLMACSLLYLFPGMRLAEWLNLSPAVWLWSVLFAISVNISMVFDAILRAEEKFFLLGKARLIGTVLFFVIVLLACLLSGSFYLFIAALMVNHLTFAVLAYRGMSVRRFRFSWQSSRKIYSYGSINMVSLGLSMVLFTSDIFIVNYFYSGYEVGIYSVYMVNVRMFFNLLFHEIFAVVFLPTVAQMDKLMLYRRLMKLTPLILPAAMLANAVLCVTLLFLFGSEYPLNWTFVALVSIGTGFHFLYWVMNSIFTVEGKKGALICLQVLGIPMPFLLGATVYLTKLYGIAGAMAASLLTQLVLIGMFIVVIRLQYGKDRLREEHNHQPSLTEWQKEDRSL
ncbi:polysaccharide biosynthesis protein [Xylanibacillus composti]|uniref:O-antigen/teichoic acid export membrane protein n=1 Tax=Xylanibacillus composti TaxID=1572762 RepID=A0A8J4M3R8_9BACL|nr:oligosaccharide flippase family protein [Xylanibacillus composti]MDT9726388.1 polysaccharide biosynthesis protein [Xylanibacillus composti]GIQ70372.1 hypothetical protein XYCOK13_31960 [Xylanibacillus composti]